MNFIAAALLAAAVVSNSPSSSDTEPLKIDRPDTTVQPWQKVASYFDQAVDADRYLMRPGDKLVVTFVKTKIASLILFVDPEGRIAHETVGVFDLAGKTLSEARAILDAALRAPTNCPYRYLSRVRSQSPLPARWPIRGFTGG